MKIKINLKAGIYASLAVLTLMASFIYFHYVLLPNSNKSKSYLEITQAPIWASLQTLELSSRKLKLNVPVIRKLDTGDGVYTVLGVAGRDQNYPYVWIILNINSGLNGIYSMPYEESFTLPCGYLKQH